MIAMTPRWEPYEEPLASVAIRTFTIAILLGVVASWIAGRPSRWYLFALLALWPSFGGHWVEVLFLNRLRPRLPAAREVHVSVRLTLWFIAGMGFAAAMRITAMTLVGSAMIRSLPWWLGGLGFVGIELAAHLALMARSRPNFYDGLG